MSSEGPPNTNSTNPHTVTSTVTLSTSQNTSLVVLPSDVSPVPDIFGRKHEEQENRHHSRKGSAAVLTSSPYKNKPQDLKRKDTRNQKSSKLQSQKKKDFGPGDVNFSVIRAQYEMERKKRDSQSSSSDSKKYEEPNLIQTDDNSDNDSECMYSSELYSRDRCGEEWIKCTKCYQWCHEECSGIDDWKTFVCSFCHTE
jgi:hypothetical protein